MSLADRAIFRLLQTPVYGPTVQQKSRWSVQNLLRLSCPEIGADEGALLETSNATTPVSRRTAVDDGVVAVT